MKLVNRQGDEHEVTREQFAHMRASGVLWLTYPDAPPRWVEDETPTGICPKCGAKPGEPTLYKGGPCPYCTPEGDHPADTSPDELPLDPKCDAGAKKTPLHLLSPYACAEAAHALQLGAQNYGEWNWREHTIKCSTYVGAIKRHLDAWWDGEELDPESGHSHMAHILASAMIVMDAENAGTLINDRPTYPKNRETP